MERVPARASAGFVRVSADKIGWSGFIGDAAVECDAACPMRRGSWAPGLVLPFIDYDLCYPELDRPGSSTKPEPSLLRGCSYQLNADQDTKLVEADCFSN